MQHEVDAVKRVLGGIGFAAQRPISFRTMPKFKAIARLKDVAKAAGVSPAVVSRVKNGDETLRISEETRARVKGAIQQLDFEPNSAARSLRSLRSGLIAVIVHDISNAVYNEIIRGLQSGADKARMAVILGDANNIRDEEARILRLIGGGGVEGVILQAAGKLPDRMLARAARNNVPIVQLQANVDIDARLVSLPDEASTRLATQHLIDLGHRDLACLATASELSFTKARLKGWRTALAASGLSTAAKQVQFCEPAGVTEGRVALERLLDKHPSVSGIVCLNPLIAIGAMHSIEEAGLRVPHDISIVSVHDLNYASALRVPLTTVATPLFELGEHAVEVLINKELPSDYRSMIVDPAPRIILRASTSRPNRWLRSRRPVEIL